MWRYWHKLCKKVYILRHKKLRERKAVRSRYHKARPVPENWAYYILCRTWRSGDAELFLVPLCRVFTAATKRGSRLPCALSLWRAAVAASPPSEGFGFRAPPVADTARKASRCRPQVQGVCRSTSGGRRGGNGGTAYKGLKRRDGRRDTPSMCEST